MVLAGRVLCVMMASVSGHVILERFYDPIPEPDQMRWRDRLHRAEASSGGAGASTVAESDCDELASRCGVARHGDENMVWCGVGDLRFYAVGSGEYDEYGRESNPPPALHPWPESVPSRLSHEILPSILPSLTPRSTRSRPTTAVAEVLQALASSVKGIVKKGFTEAHAFEHYGMICLALDEIVSDGVVEATTWDTIRRATKLKMAD